MKRAIVIVALLLLVPATVSAAGPKQAKQGPLNGWDEVPSVSTVATGNFQAVIHPDGTQVDWELSYDALEGPVTQAHIHLGQVGVNGGIAVFLCTNLGNGPAGTQPCPAPPATISGSFRASDIVGPASQGLTTGEMDELIRAIRAGVTYCNVHSQMFPGGEIRVQLSDKL